MFYNESKPFTANHIIKLFTDAVGQDAFADLYGINWDARKKEIQKLQKSEITEDMFSRFVDILNEFTSWCKEKDYINSWDYHAVCDFLIPFISAIRFTPNNLIPTKDFVEYSTMYAICFTYKRSIDSYKELKDENKPCNELIAAIMQFNYWLPSNNYTKDINPLEGMFNLLFALTKDKRKLIDFWNNRKEELQDKGKFTDLDTQIKRWISGKQRPTWKHIKLFLDESLLPKESLMNNPLADEFSNEEMYLTFRRKIFPACFITKFFDSLEEQELIHENSRLMIRKGIRLFYHHCLTTRDNSFTEEEQQNPMFCMMVHFLIKKDFGFEFNTDTAQYFKRILF